MAARTISRTTIVAVLIATVAALVARSWLQRQLLSAGTDAHLAANLTYLIVPVVLMIALFPLWQNERDYLRSQFRISDLNWTLVGTAVLIGVLLRLLWWAQLVLGISTGVYTSPDTIVISNPEFRFQCPSNGVVALSVLVASVFQPVVEESINRGYILAVLIPRGFYPAIIVSALVFALLHSVGSIPYAFVAGLALGVQYWYTRSLWPSLITHSTVNTLSIFDWLCLSGQWNPAASALPLWKPAIIATVLITLCAIALICLLRKKATEA